MKLINEFSLDRPIKGRVNIEISDKAGTVGKSSFMAIDEITSVKIYKSSKGYNIKLIKAES